jgi:hypothetical protein
MEDKMGISHSHQTPIRGRGGGGDGVGGGGGGGEGGGQSSERLTKIGTDLESLSRRLESMEK